jgi:superfamily I DNA/RNA helicase
MIQVEDWSPSNGLLLEPNAEIAVRARQGCVALLAGPGAGKTETLAQRADFLLRTSTCSYPRRILAISFKKDASENLKERVSTRCGHQLASRFDSYTFHAFAKRLIDIFRTHLQGIDRLDEDYTIGTFRVSRSQIMFEDMVPLANDIVSQCEIARNSIRQTYSDVFLDEFQDCTATQYSLVINAFQGSGVRIVAVGDTKQKIMGWAGALDGIFVNFGADFQALSLNLYQNFRSQVRIRRVQNRMIRDIDPPAAVPETQLSGPEGIVCYEAFDEDRLEAAWISSSIQKWISEGVPLGEIAILCNTQPHLYALKVMAALKELGIPFRNEQLVQDLFSEPVFQLIVDFLILLTGDAEPDAWERFHQLVEYNAGANDADMKVREWSRFIQLHKVRVDGLTVFLPLWQSVEEMLQRMGVEGIRMLSYDYESEQRYNEILADAKAIVGEAFDATGDFAEALKALGKDDAVRVLTIHKCKGLEFHSVIVQGVETQTFFGSHLAAQCAYFVALSRARKRLVVTTSNFREKPEGANRHWREARTMHGQFLNYVLPEVGG